MFRPPPRELADNSGGSGCTLGLIWLAISPNCSRERHEAPLLLASVAVVTGFGSFEMDSALPGRMTYSGSMDDCTTWQSEEDCVRRGCGWLNKKKGGKCGPCNTVNNKKKCTKLSGCDWTQISNGKSGCSPEPPSIPTSCSRAPTQPDCDKIDGCGWVTRSTTFNMNSCNPCSLATTDEECRDLQGCTTCK